MIPTHPWILGATGYIGGAITRELLAEEHSIPVAVGRRRLPGSSLEGAIYLPTGLEGLTIDWLERFPPTLVFHCARRAGSLPLLRKISSLRGNRANKKLLAQLTSLNQPPPLVYVSGSLMYGNSSEMVFEDHPINPLGFAKPYIKAEEPFIDGRNYSKVIMARPGWILGPSSWFHHYFYNYYLNHNAVPFYGSGEQLMSIISLEDCARLIIHVAKESQHHVQNIYTFNPISQREFAQKVADNLNAPIQQVEERSIEKMYDKHVAEALCSSCPLDTNYPNVIASFQPKHDNLDSLIRQVIDQLSS